MQQFLRQQILMHPTTNGKEGGGVQKGGGRPIESKGYGVPDRPAAQSVKGHGGANGRIRNSVGGTPKRRGRGGLSCRTALF